ncbi:hypothetical protein PI87_19240 [Ralstonia sp. A12]|nr:hypothetical protein PI87_19240 [Ralstonia sp. A12]
MSRVALLACVLVIVSTAQAEGVRVIPRSEQADGGYVSTQLLLKPCLDIRTQVNEPSDHLLKDVADARKVLPPGICDSPVLVEKLFKVRFLQYASLAVVSDPWNFDVKIAMQNRSIEQCKDTQCVERGLDAVIAALSPVYLGARPEWPQGTGLCTAAPVDVSVATALAPLNAKTRKALIERCGEQALTTQACTGPHGKLLFGICEMVGNQVNASEWVYLVRGNKYEPLLAIDDGPFGVMESTCNGMPDLMTAARISMGEHQHTYYRYDGKDYQSVYSYTAIGVGTDDNGNDLEVAQGGPDTKVVCR